MSKQRKAASLHVLAFALSAAIIWAVATFFLGISAATPSQYGSVIVEIIGTVYKGYEPGGQGAFIGSLWAFADAGLGALLFAWLYNVLAKKLK